MFKYTIVLYVVALLALAVMSAGAQAGQNHYDPNNKAFDRAQAGKPWHKAWKKHYGHKKSKRSWHDNKRQDGLQPLVTAIDYATRNIYIFNYENDEMITIQQSEIQDWPGDLPLQHTAITADGQHMWVSSDATVNEPPMIFRLGIKKLNWNNNTAKLKVESVSEVGGVGEPATYTPAEEVGGSIQSTPAWIQPSMTQVHAFTFLPFSDWMYTTEYPTDKVHILKNRKHKTVLKDTVQIDGWTEQTHGVMFNASGSTGVGVGYFFDNTKLDVYKPNRKTGELVPFGQIELAMEGENGEKFVAAMTHLISWLDERYAVTASMQFDRTSLTPADVDGFIGPSIWLLDTVDLTATKIIDQATNVGGGGVFRSASDVAVVNGKLYIAEEDSILLPHIDDARDGFVSVFDLSDRLNPVFLKRLEPGVDLPAGYNIAHTFSPSVDGRFVIVGSWHSGYVIKIDTYDDTVAHIWGPDDGLVMPHGVFAAGGLR